MPTAGGSCAWPMASIPSRTMNSGVYGALKFPTARARPARRRQRAPWPLQGVRHNLGSREALVLWGDGRFPVLPAWFTSRFPARFTSTPACSTGRTRRWPTRPTTPPGLPEDLRVWLPPSVPFWSCCTPEAGVKQSLEEACKYLRWTAFPARDLLGQLLSCCASVKAVRLFLTSRARPASWMSDALLSSTRFAPAATRAG